jgi:NADH-quinone oxidoreductase subunit A
MLRLVLLLLLPALAAAAEPAAPLGHTLPLVVLVLLALLVPGAILLLSQVLGPSRVNTPAKDAAYECGLQQPIGGAGDRLSVKFYLVALLFLVFDIEVAFLYPLVLNFREGGWPLFGVLGLFLVMLEATYLYLYHKGALSWER